MFPAQSHAMNRGIAFHGGVERATEHMIETGETRIPGEVGRDFAEGYLADHPELVLPESERDALRLMAWNWAEGTVLDLEHLVGSEIEVRIPLNGWLLRCRIDLVYAYEDFVKVVDYKTSLAMTTEEALFRDFQARFYSLAVLEGEVANAPVPIGAGLNDVDFSLVYPRYRDNETGTLIGRHAAFTRMDLQDFKATLADLLDRVERAYDSQEWPAVDGSHCSTCAAQALCPIRPVLRDEPQVSNEAEARELAVETDVLERQVRRNKKGLKGWVAENGTLFFGSDLAMDITATESKSVKDWPALEDGIRRAVEFGEPFDLGVYRKTKHGTRFARRKRTEEELDGAD
jgi:hypothetical protein